MKWMFVCDTALIVVHSLLLLLEEIKHGVKVDFKARDGVFEVEVSEDLRVKHTD